MKGITAALGKGTGITKFVRPISFKVNENSKPSDIADSLLTSNILGEGDIVVIPSKVIAILEKRFVYGLTMENYRQCINNLNFARANLTTPDSDPISEKDVIGLDKLDPEKKIGLRYPKNPNLSCYEIAKRVKDASGLKIDVVVSDSDAGGAKGVKLIGCPTILVTPIGATKGLRLFYCMRVAVAAEAIWNNVENTPIVLAQLYHSVYKTREGVGEFRYDGFLNAHKEPDIISRLQDNS
ncbi:MAG: hypothetical protein A2117_00080 [Candidatus Wildermuthbacteria bacterium GWA2_46_15]|uniref:Coenzyme F420:L-glutamate ligase-like domain-containing protein n=1 Tax=Candidatus Wildermuthbacteria bacterium GWA2_46_15 TaxID=1802443 RepID=A0A1G2QPP1_9BACT|nr:MAG: hypothetical protein A2117_00080 [Candidatus Wildermuthbacteria bacterium GWA2_46_15]